MSFSLAFDISDHEPLKLMARQAAWNLVRQIRSADDVAIPQLKTDNETVRDFAADKRKLENALSGISSSNQLADLIAEAVKILDDGRYNSRPALQSRLRRTRNLLTRLAKVSGGLALVVKNENELSAATKQIIHRLKNQYTIGYYPTNDKHDGSFRYVRVTVTPKDKHKVKVFAPLGYYAVDPEKIREEKNNDK